MPFASHYRPIWMGLGIVALYLLLAVWVSSRLRHRIGHRLWRQIHVLAFAVYAAATLHGLGTGSDTRTIWAVALYATSVGLVGTLLAAQAARAGGPRRASAARSPRAQRAPQSWRSPPGRSAGRSRPAGPRARAGRTAHARSRHRRERRARGPPRRSRPTAVVHVPFTARYAGRLTVEPVNDRGRLTVRIDGALSGATKDHLEILIHGIPLEDGGVAMEQSRVRMGTTTPLYDGEITSLDGTRLVAALRSSRQRLRLGLVLRISRDGRVVGQVQGTASA